MGSIGVRLKDSIDLLLRRQARALRISLSDHIRTIILTHLKDSSNGTMLKKHEWRILVYNLLGVNEHQIRYALNTSANVHEFFSILSKWVKRCKIHIAPEDISFITGDKGDSPKVTTIPIPPGAKVDKISSIMERLDEKMTEEYYEAENVL